MPLSIGTILRIVDKVEKRVGAENSLDDTYAIKALLKFVKINVNSASRLLGAI
jgi:hypothetical protein